MTGGAAAGGAAGAAGAAGGAYAAAIANAIKASGAIVHVEPEDFEIILSKAESPLVVTAQGGFWSKNFQYLTAYKGLIFFTKCKVPFEFEGEFELIMAKKIWIPG